jgi:hypothetical protein
MRFSKKGGFWYWFGVLLLIIWSKDISLWHDLSGSKKAKTYWFYCYNYWFYCYNWWREWFRRPR